MFDWINHIFHSIVGWFHPSEKTKTLKHLEYLDLDDDDFFKDCPILTEEEIRAQQLPLSQSMPNLKDHYEIIKTNEDKNREIKNREIKKVE